MRRGKKGTELIFDRNKRVEFVTGFKRRKDERREVAKQKIKEEEMEVRKQNRQIKYKQRDRINEQYDQIRQIMRINDDPIEIEGASDSEEGEAKYEKC